MIAWSGRTIKSQVPRTRDRRLPSPVAGFAFWGGGMPVDLHNRHYLGVRDWRLRNVAYEDDYPELYARVTALLRRNRQGDATADDFKAAWREIKGLGKSNFRRAKTGRKGYPLAALKFALALRERHPEMKALTIRAKCLQKFNADDLPPTADAFRRWLNGPHQNRAN